MLNAKLVVGNLKKNIDFRLIAIVLLFIGAIVVVSYKAFFSEKNNTSAIDSATYNRLQTLEKDYIAIKRERAALSLVIQDQSKAIEVLNSQLKNSRDNYKKFDQILKKIQSRYEELNRFDNYSPDSIALYFPNRYGQ